MLVRWLRLSRHASQLPHNPVACRDRAGDNKDGVVSAHGAEDIRPTFTVERGCDRLGAARHGAQHEHLTDSIEAKEELGKEGVEGRTTLLNASVGNGVAGSVWSRHACQAQLAEIAGQRGLSDIPSALEEELPEVLLATHDARLDDLEYRIVSLAFVCHVPSLACKRCPREMARV